MNQSGVSVLIRLRPNRQYVLLLLLVAAVPLLAATMNGPIGAVVSVVCGLLLVLLGYPVVVSTLLRVPVLSVTDAGLRLPLMGVQLTWPEVTGTRQALRRRAEGRPDIPVLLIVPADPQATVRQVRPWLRREARQELARYGSPIAVSDLSLDHSLAQIEEAITRYLLAGGIVAGDPGQRP
jgi:hypothetical protein